MINTHLCPCCSQPLLRHISFKRRYWFCVHCYQEMPDIEDLVETGLPAQHWIDNKIIACRHPEDGLQEKQKLCSDIKTNKELQRLDLSDKLAQVANRLRFQAYIDQEWRHMAWQQAPLSLILGDLDCFKAYNDTYGRQAGDNCLQQVAQAVVCAVNSPVDIVPRYGGEEFVVILPNTKAEDAVQIAEEIRGAIKALKIAHINSQPSHYLTLSLGVASIIPSNEYSGRMLINAADQALCQAKAQGRDRVILYEDLLRQTKVVEHKEMLALQPSQASTPVLQSGDNGGDTKTDLLMSYVAYYVSRGKSVLSPSSGSIRFEGSVYQYWGYHQDFQDFWRQLASRRDFSDLHIEGDLYSFGRFLSGNCTVGECARCNLPIPMTDGSAPDIPNCTLCNDFWRSQSRLDDPKSQECEDASISQIVAIGGTPSNRENLQEWFSLNGVNVTFVSKPEDIGFQPLPATVDLVLIHGEISQAQGNAWAQQLSHYPQFQGVPIIALSTKAGHGLPWMERTLEVRDYVLTPYNGDHLAQHLRQVVKPVVSNNTADLHWFPK